MTSFCVPPHKNGVDVAHEVVRAKLSQDGASVGVDEETHRLTPFPTGSAQICPEGHGWPLAQSLTHTFVLYELEVLGTQTVPVGHECVSHVCWHVPETQLSDSSPPVQSMHCAP